MSNKWFYIHTFNLIAIYTVGMCGIAFTHAADRELFLRITPLNLMVTTFFALLFHTGWNRRIVFSGVIVFLAGFFIEVIGVKTGAIFGSYWYGKTLGWKQMEVPLMIGVNWFLLVYIIAATYDKIKNIFVFAIVGAATMTLLDVLIEPVAIRLDFWQWQDDIIPVQNYVAWFLISFLLFMFFRQANGRIKNRFSIIVLSVQFLFFALLNLLLNK